MYIKSLCSIVFLIVLSMAFSIEDGKDNMIELGCHNVRDLGNDEYLIDIYARNQKPIAGVQFEILGENFKILDVGGGRADRSGFSFHFGGKNKGVILAFSMQGNTIAPRNTGQKKNMMTLCTIKLKKNLADAVEFNINPLIADKKGIKLDSYFIPIIID